MSLAESLSLKNKKNQNQSNCVSSSYRFPTVAIFLLLSFILSKNLYVHIYLGELRYKSVVKIAESFAPPVVIMIEMD